jgi:hypothetical protein
MMMSGVSNPIAVALSRRTSGLKCRFIKQVCRGFTWTLVSPSGQENLAGECEWKSGLIWGRNTDLPMAARRMKND